MRIRTLQLVEDSNELTATELEGYDLVTPYTVRAPKEIRIAKRVVAIARVDRIPAGVEIDLPDRQAKNLIALGLAEVVDPA